MPNDVAPNDTNPSHDNVTHWWPVFSIPVKSFRTHLDKLETAFCIATDY